MSNLENEIKKLMCDESSIIYTLTKWYGMNKVLTATLQYLNENPKAILAQLTDNDFNMIKQKLDIT